jgi:hypothetical protein
VQVRVFGVLVSVHLESERAGLYAVEVVAAALSAQVKDTTRLTSVYVDGVDVLTLVRTNESAR